MTGPTPHVEHLERPPGMPPVNGYSHVSRGAGRLVTVAGQLPLDAAGVLVLGDAYAQAVQVFVNLDLALRAAGVERADILRFGFYVVDLAVLPALRRARDEFLGDGPRPSSSAVQVAGLVLPGALLEIDLLAVTG